MNLLRYLFKNHNTDKINFDELSMTTEGFVAHDIVDFYDKTIFVINKECERRGNKIEPIRNIDDNQSFQLMMQIYLTSVNIIVILP